jgi:hypothetical protein
MLRVVGVAVEVALVLVATHGVGELNSDMLGASVDFSHVVVNGIYQGAVKVRLFPEDAILAVTLVIDMVTRLRRAFYSIMPVRQYGRQTHGVVVPQRGQDSSIIGAHDMILDSLIGPKGRISTEVKLRYTRDDHHLEYVRKKVHTDCNLTWHAAILESPGVYGGQMLLMYTFPYQDSRSSWVSRAEMRKQNDDWKALWGWRTAVEPARVVPQVAPVRSLPQQQQGAALAGRGRKRPWDELQLDWFDEGPRANPVRMASVSQMIAQAGKKDVSKVKRFIDAARRDYQWPNGSLKHTKNAGSSLGRAGGKPGWAASEAVLRDLHRALRF